MRVLLINTSERVGGAAIAANRLMEALKRNGVKAQMLVRDRQTQQLTVSAVRQSWLLPMKFLWERMVIFLRNGWNRKRMWQVDLANVGTDVTSMPEFQYADVIHLHWVNQGFLSLADLQKILTSGKPVVVTMHDEWYFTGVCHYSGACERYKTTCQACPLMGGRTWLPDLAQKVFNKKKQLYGMGKLTFVGCSQWMASMARESSLLKGIRVESIPNAINTELFRPTDKDLARESLGLPKDAPLILFSAQRTTDPRKGFALLTEALRLLDESMTDQSQRPTLVVVGGQSDKIDVALPFPVVSIKYLEKETDMVSLYNAVDVYVTPSLEDNLPNTVMESLACGTPCVGFRVGGIPEMIDHQQNGYVANYKDAADLAEGIRWTLAPERRESLHEAARKKVMENYTEQRVARLYSEIYES